MNLFVLLLSLWILNPENKLAQAAMSQTQISVAYDPSYYRISFPNGDVPKGKGVCTDVVIRSYRLLGIDLQKLVYEDRRKHGEKTDTNIDHRRCTNLIKFFTRQGAKLPVTQKGSDYLPGDLVFWDIAYGHVGVVSNEKVPGTDRYYMVHNICCGNQKEDFLFSAKIVAHFRWNP